MPVDVLLNLRAVGARHIRLQLRLRRQVVDEDGDVAEELAVLVRHHWDSAARVLCQEFNVLVLAKEDVHILVFVLDP